MAQASLQSTPAHAGVWGRVDPRVTRLLVVSGVTLLALALRWPYLMLVPRFTDELREMEWTLQIARGEILPLTNVSAFIGIVPLYLVAGLLKLFGPQLWLPRAVVAIFGALLAGLVAWLAWEMAGTIIDRRPPTIGQTTDDGRRTTGMNAQGGGVGSRSAVVVASLVAGLLTATSFSLILINSHLAWSNSTTPFFVTLALAVTWLAVARGRGVWLVVSGCLWGIALQSHPGVAPFLPGVLLWYLWQPQGRAWLRRPWPWLAVTGFALGYLNILWLMFAPGNPVATEAQGARFGRPDSLTAFGERLGALFIQLGRMLAGAYAPPTAEATPLTITPAVPLFALVAIAALLWCLRDREMSILPIVAGSGMLLLALTTNTLDLSRAFNALYDTRYLASLLPLVYLALGLAAATIWGAASTTGRGGVAIAALAMMGLPLLSLRGFYTDSQARGLTNAPFLALADAAREVGAQGGFILVDKKAGTVHTGGGGDSQDTSESLFEFYGLDHRRSDPSQIRYFLTHSEAPMLLLLGEQATTDLRDSPGLTLLPLDVPGYQVFAAAPAR